MHNKSPDGKITFSPSDLCLFTESPFASWMDHLELVAPGTYKRDGDDPMNKILQNHGIKHESSTLARLQSEGKTVKDLTGSRRPEDTLAAMQSGVDLIYQAPLATGSFAGIADFLMKAPGTSSLGNYHYEVWDSKLAGSTKAYFLLQLSAYADMIVALQGVKPENVGVFLGDGKSEAFRTQSFFSYYTAVKQHFLDFHRDFNPEKAPDPALVRSYGRWSEAAETIIKANDSVAQVARVSKSQMRKLAVVGIKTVTELATTPLQSVHGIAQEVFERLKAQAHIQWTSRGQGIPRWELLKRSPANGKGALPPSNLMDIFFDMEGFPLTKDGLEYLWGWVQIDKSGPEFCCLWAHDHDSESQAFEKFVSMVHQRWTANPGMHVYHYASYEPSTIKRLAGKRGLCERQVDDLLRNGVFVDLYEVIKNNFLVGTQSYSLKKIELLYRDKRSASLKDAASSVVFYQNWLDTRAKNGPQDREQSNRILEEIRQYNEDDCRSTFELERWIRKVFEDHNHHTEQTIEEPRSIEDDSELKDLKYRLTQLGNVGVLIADLLGYKLREQRPEWWAYFARLEGDDQMLYEDSECLAQLQRTKTPPINEKRSLVYEYKFDPDQEFKGHAGSSMRSQMEPDTKIEIFEMEESVGLIRLKKSGKDPMPERVNLIPERPGKTAYEKNVLEYASSYADGQRHRALDDFLCRNPPRLTTGTLPGRTVGDKTEPNTMTQDIVKTVENLNESSLIIQGPPGSGKTYVGSHCIASLVKSGKRIGIMSNSHKAIDNLLLASVAVMESQNIPACVIKIDGDSSIDHKKVKIVDRAGLLQKGDSFDVVGGTVWAFSHDNLDSTLDYLFIDEAGQVSLAHLVSVARSTKNLVFLGDQMQLSQPTKGTHPRESGLSCLDYFLQGHATIPLDLGIFLNKTRRLHPDICRVISQQVYDGRLEPFTTNKNRLIKPNGTEKYVQKNAGIIHVPVNHQGNRQQSDEEADVVCSIVEELLRTNHSDINGKDLRKLKPEDILIVSPYNLQVKLLDKKLGTDRFRVGTVDKFQGQEAPVVIVSFAASSAEEAPRGIKFLFDKHRLNVAVSRAQSLAILVSSADLQNTFVNDVDSMELVNFFLELLAQGGGGSWVDDEAA